MQHDQQVASVLHRTVQQVLTRGVNDPRVKGLITVTQVRLSSDGREATVHVSVEPAQHEELTMHGLRHAARHVRWHVAKLARMRRMPDLHFKLDRSLKKQAEVHAAIQRGLQREDENAAARAAAAGDAPTEGVPSAEPPPDES